MARFRKWLCGILSDGHGRNEDARALEGRIPPVLPGLPPARKHALTPRPSLEDIYQIPRPNGAIFDRLPVELRDQILIFAFGDRTIHIDLQFDLPKLPDSSRHLAHAHVSVSGETDWMAPPRWAWWSSVCHRNLAAEPWDDRCQSGSPRKICCGIYPGDSCFLGVMGWLLTCRQA